MRPSPFYTFGFNITRDYCVNITRDLVFESHTPAVYFYRRYELTNLSTFLFSTLLFGHTHPRPSLLSTTSSPLSPVYSDGGYATSLFIRSDSLLREITLQCYERFMCQHRDRLMCQHYERFGFIVTRDLDSLLREI